MPTHSNQAEPLPAGRGVVTAVVLAAGRGRRLGSVKALAAIAGRTALARVVDACRSAPLDEVVVVTGSDAELVEDAVGALAEAGSVPVRWARNPDWERGRTGSLQVGWSAAAPGSHVLLFPVDHPAVRVVTLDLLVGAFGYAAATPDVVVPVVQDGSTRRRGHPIVLAARLREDVFALGPDDPLRDLVRRRAVLEVPVDDPGILLDVNTPEDLARAEELLAEDASRA